jgi:hypothetical protein
MPSRVGKVSRRSGEVERLQRLLVRLSSEDRQAFEAIVRLMLRTVPRRYKKVYAK